MDGAPSSAGQDGRGPRRRDATKFCKHARPDEARRSAGRDGSSTPSPSDGMILAPETFARIGKAEARYARRVVIRGGAVADRGFMPGWCALVH